MEVMVNTPPKIAEPVPIVRMVLLRISDMFTMPCIYDKNIGSKVVLLPS